jgi:Fe2+ or Zn2+ uptake regulation protein
MFNPDLLESLAKREQWYKCKHEKYEKYGHANLRCKKCGAIFKVGYMEAKMKEGDHK